MRIYTRTGDGGQTGLIGGARVGKDDPVIAVVGSLDETNCALGLARALLGGGPLDATLHRAQSALFEAGAEVACPADSPYFTEAKVDGLTLELEASIDELTAQLPALKNFILPGGAPGAAQLHLARSVCRRAERELVALAQSRPVRAELLAFVNRLSDWLFTAARSANQTAGAVETVWTRDR